MVMGIGARLWLIHQNKLIKLVRYWVIKYPRLKKLMGFGIDWTKITVLKIKERRETYEQDPRYTKRLTR